jgi:hypothetical protein
VTAIVIFDLPNHEPLLNEQVVKVDTFMAKHGAVRENAGIGRGFGMAVLHYTVPPEFAVSEQEATDAVGVAMTMNRLSRLTAT